MCSTFAWSIRPTAIVALAAALCSPFNLVAQETRLSSLATRGPVGTGGSVMISGFNISAGAARTVLIRAAGPSLANFSVTGLLANPKLELFDSAGAKIAENDDWGGTPALSTAFASAGAFAFNASSPESALVLTLPAGGYTAQVSGLNATTGVGLVEVYDLAGGTNSLTSLSTRGPVGTGSAVLVAGFNLAPAATTRRLLVRAVGPTLSTFALSGVLADPRLEIFNSAGAKVAENDDWGTVSSSAGAALPADAATLASAFSRAGAFAYTGPTSKDSALLIDLPAGGYTAQVSGVNSATGLALVELYDVTAAGIVVAPTAPTITTPPASLAVAAGTGATFTVAATGTAPLAYQWRKDGVAITGASAATYTISSTTSASAGVYTVVVTNSVGGTTSAAATLTVTTASIGADTAAAVAAAQAFLATLSPAQQATTQSAWSLAAARRWSNLPASSNFVPRNGIAWSSLNATQRTAATALLASVLSPAGQTLVTGMQAADDYLAANGGGTASYGSGYYHFALYGTPSLTDFWVLQFTGHHLTHHFTFNGTYKSGTPLFLGVEPRTSFTLNGTVYDPMAAQRTAAADLFSSLTAYSPALLTGTYTDILFGANGTGNIDNTYPKAYPTAATGRGVLYPALSAPDQEKTKTFIRAYVNTQAAEVAADLLTAYLSDTALASTYVAYAGPANIATSNSYLRIDGPRVWIELSVQGGIIIRNEPHYHGIWRDKVGDYGGNF